MKVGNFGYVHTRIAFENITKYRPHKDVYGLFSVATLSISLRVDALLPTSMASVLLKRLKLTKPSERQKYQRAILSDVISTNHIRCL